MKVALIMGSDSDWSVLEKTSHTLKQFGIEQEVRVLSAHRTPEDAANFAALAEERGIDMIIAAAGMAAHLAGAMAAHSALPVIGIPIQSGSMNGMDALLSTVMMPPGVPVACVGVNAAQNAALLAVQILSVKDADLRKKFKLYKEDMKDAVRKKDEALAKKLAQ